MTDTSTPDITCKPIDTLDEVFAYAENPPSWAAKCLKYNATKKLRNRNWDFHRGEDFRYFCHQNIENGAVCDRYEQGLLPKTLVCHDMMNGYHDDSFVEGTSDADAYHFSDWSAVDTFCYFSHHFVTLPPLSWINAAHKHDAKVLGTLITEWDDGIKKWDQILSTPEYSRQFADSLVTITKHLKFEGWLLNVENKIAKPDDLLVFIKYFREQLHKEIPGAELIWYDSVTIKGDLSWQNALNENNVDFFRACDGIFTNYSWTEDHIKKSADLAKQEGRLLDVYIGIDVWGRNFYGGGMFNTVEAVKIAFKHGCSLALFANAWTYEAVDENEKYPVLDSEVGCEKSLSKREQFLLRERAFWDSLWPYLNTRLVSEVPFQTSFCRGNGKSLWRNGEIINAGPWHNMASMEYQPTSNHGTHGYRLTQVDKDDPSALIIIGPPVPSANVTETNTSGIYKNFKGVFTETAKLISNSGSAKLPQTENANAESQGNKVPTAEIKEVDEIDRKTIPQSVIESNVIANTTVEATTAETSKLNATVVVYKLALVENEKRCLDHHGEEAFNGGSSVIISPSGETDSDGNSPAVVLFHCEFSCENKLIINIVTKPTEYIDQSLDVIFTLTKNGGKDKFHVYLTEQNQSYPVRSVASKHLKMQKVLPVSSTELPDLRKFLDKSGLYVPVDNNASWRVRYFILDHPKTTVKSISCRTATDKGSILLGLIGICSVD